MKILKIKCPRTCPLSTNHEISCPRNQMISQYNGLLWFLIYRWVLHKCWHNIGMCIMHNAATGLYV